MTTDDIARLKELERRCTAAPWEAQTGCSWRRIGTPGNDGNVLCPTLHPRDKHPDLIVEESDLEYICLLRNHAPALIRAAERERLLQECLDVLTTPAGPGATGRAAYLDRVRTAAAALDAFDKQNPRAGG